MPVGFQRGAAWKGNAKGRPKQSESMPEYVKAKTQGGKALIDFYVNVLNDDTQSTQARLYACDKLVERAFGKAPQVIEGDKPQDSGITLIIQRPSSAHAGTRKIDEVFTVRQIEPPREPTDVSPDQTQENSSDSNT